MVPQEFKRGKMMPFRSEDEGWAMPYMLMIKIHKFTPPLPDDHRLAARKHNTERKRPLLLIPAFAKLTASIKLPMMHWSRLPRGTSKAKATAIKKTSSLSRMHMALRFCSSVNNTTAPPSESRTRTSRSTNIQRQHISDIRRGHEVKEHMRGHSLVSSHWRHTHRYKNPYGLNALQGRVPKTNGGVLY
ncbi:hypothetical protein BU23DRAFT_571344 [Bimuria novae-zelandiae CBS 107.79]|uniref:Uncharacterized protein n=1 Tax=Bimuria novae-zelandiae CBS 107.79 TaxID=1447943 RepID=A0A6A5UXR7_9PLEO|nr:hypothetical protein BU23DRAFT_571344 [Bimuria novae-zelandiae CBS 107.79]